MKRVSPFSWIDDNGILHHSAEEILRCVGLPVTEENLRIAAAALIDGVRRDYPETQIRVVTREDQPEKYVSPETYLMHPERSN